MEPILPASVHTQPALAGIPTEMMGESQEATESALQWDGILNAVPKSKVSHSRKAMRHANKGHKDRVGELIGNCDESICSLSSSVEQLPIAFVC
jgi:hypothetical protein